MRTVKNYGLPAKPHPICQPSLNISPKKLLLFLILLSLVPLAFLPRTVQGADNEENSNSELILGVRTDAPPFSFCTDNEASENCQGYSVALCQLIAERAVETEGLYCDIRYQKVTSANRFKMLEENTIHLLCGASTVTLERMRVADFSLFTFISGASIMFRKPDVQQTQQKDPKSQAFMVGVLDGTTSKKQVAGIMKTFAGKQDTFPKNIVANYEVITVQDHNEGLAQIIEGNIQAYIADREILIWLSKKGLRQDKEAQLIVLNDYFSYEPYAIGIQLHNTNLRHVANSVLSELYDWDNGRAGENNIFTILRKNFPGKRFSTSLEDLFRLQRLSQGERLTGFMPRAECRE